MTRAVEEKRPLALRPQASLRLLLIRPRCAQLDQTIVLLYGGGDKKQGSVS